MKRNKQELLREFTHLDFGSYLNLLDRHDCHLKTIKFLKRKLKRWEASYSKDRKSWIKSYKKEMIAKIKKY